MKTEQISIFLENRAGRLAEVMNTLAIADINIRALALSDTSDFGILRMIVSDTRKAQMLLKEKGFTIDCTTVVAVEVPDKPGGLNTVLQILARYEINVDYMYAFVPTNLSRAILIFRFDKYNEASYILKDNGCNVLSGEQLCSC